VKISVKKKEFQLVNRMNIDTNDDFDGELTV